MIVAGQRLPILIAAKPVDFRCGHQALALMVQTELKLDPHSGVTTYLSHVTGADFRATRIRRVVYGRGRLAREFVLH
jgi:transposase